MVSLVFSSFFSRKAPATKQVLATRDQYHETHLSTQLPQAGTYTRFPCPFSHTQWAQGPQCPQGKGTGAPGALNVPADAAVDRESQRFPRGVRLLEPNDYQAIFNDSVKSADGYFTVLARVNGRDHGRLGLAISKKCARRAVDRNRLKRIARESFRLHQHRLAGRDVIVMCRRKSINAVNQRLFTSLTDHWQQVLAKLCARS